ncbi:Hpt domain-containing protein [Clostridium sp.]|jgi:HPt (histidine-containing phosphotransfer) domain-containing protein|uniref:Hpt domain-containing protein n=1 Tax=Clostridium sp. TaxID=1506 RepID=UPI003EE96F2E
MVSEIYDIVGLSKDLELECEDITDLYVSYIDDIADHCHKIKETFSKKDFIELRSEVHNVKGVSANLLLKDVFEEADSFEKLLTCGDFLGSNEHVEALSNLLINSKNKIIQSFAQVKIIL